jgi:hypothetical protein
LPRPRRPQRTPKAPKTGTDRFGKGIFERFISRLSPRSPSPPSGPKHAASLLPFLASPFVKLHFDAGVGVSAPCPCEPPGRGFFCVSACKWSVLYGWVLLVQERSPSRASSCGRGSFTPKALPGEPLVASFPAASALIAQAIGGPGSPYWVGLLSPRVAACAAAYSHASQQCAAAGDGALARSGGGGLYPGGPTHDDPRRAARRCQVRTVAAYTAFWCRVRIQRAVHPWRTVGARCIPKNRRLGRN